MPYLAEVAEAEASGEIARIYAEIRRLTGVPFVALVYRHLATVPQALEGLWRLVAPLLLSGDLQECAWRMSRDAWTASVPDLPRNVAALGEAELSRIADVIAAYNRANPVNFAIVSVIGAPSPTFVTAREPSGAVWIPPPALRSLPPIPPVGDLPPEVRTLVDAFGKRGPGGNSILVPTLYRHLAHWPGFLALAQREVLPRVAGGAFQPMIDAFRIGMQREAAVFASDRAMASDPLLGVAAPVLERFAGVIPEMVVVGSFLSRILARP